MCKSEKSTPEWTLIFIKSCRNKWLFLPNLKIKGKCKRLIKSLNLCGNL